MTSLEMVKNKVKELYYTHPDICINVSISKPRVCLKNEPVTIKNIYPHIFQIEERSACHKCYTIQYTDLLTRQIEIVEPDIGGSRA